MERQAKFPRGSWVRILENRLQPKSVGQKGVITNIYTDAETGEALYKVRLYGRKTPLRGVAEERCLEALKEGER